MNLLTILATAFRWVAGKLDGKVWLGLGAAALVCASLFLGAWHERRIGAAECQARITAAQAAYDKQAQDMQAKLDSEAAAHDAALRAAANAPWAPAPMLALACRLTDAQVEAAQGALR